MELQTQNGYELIKTEELHKLKEVSQFIPIVRNAVSKAWRMMDELEKRLNETIGGKSEHITK